MITVNVVSRSVLVTLREFSEVTQKVMQSSVARESAERQESCCAQPGHQFAWQFTFFLTLSSPLMFRILDMSLHDIWPADQFDVREHVAKKYDLHTMMNENCQ